MASRPRAAHVGGREPGTPESGCDPFVSVMKPTNLRNGYDRVVTQRGDRTRDRRVLVERQVSPRLFVVRPIEGEKSLQSRCAEHEDMIEAFPP